MKTKLLTIEEICAELGVGKNTAYKLVKNMKYVKIGRRILVPEDELEAYVEREIGKRVKEGLV
jgi:excisionase family DNA binding protein